MRTSMEGRVRRSDLMRGGLAAGAALLLGRTRTAGTAGTADAADQRTGGAAVQEILDTALTAENLALTFYYTGLTTPAIMHDHRLGGPSADPNNPGQAPGGDPANVKDLQAILDSEAKHARSLFDAGGVSPYTRVYFPSATFTRLGRPDDPGSFLGVLNALETAFVGAYLAAVDRSLALGRPDLAGVLMQIMGVEAEHRMLGRLISGDGTANNLTLQDAPFAGLADARASLRPYLTGKGFAAGATPPIPVPSPPRAGRVVGRYATRLVRAFL